MYYLGTIITAAAGAAADNLSTATPFVIPQGVTRVLIILPNDATNNGWGVQVAPSGYAAANANAYNPASGNVSLQAQCPTGFGGNTIVSIYTPAGGTVNANVKVYALFGPAST